MQAPRRIAGPQAKAGSKAPGAGAADSHQATFVWRIEHFSRLKDVLKKRKITGLCVKSRRFLVGGYTCRLIIYPRGGHTYPFQAPLLDTPGGRLLTACICARAFLSPAIMHLMLTIKNSQSERTDLALSLQFANLSRAITEYDSCSYCSF